METFSRRALYQGPALLPILTHMGAAPRHEINGVAQAQPTVSRISQARKESFINTVNVVLSLLRRPSGERVLFLALLLLFLDTLVRV